MKIFTWQNEHRSSSGVQLSVIRSCKQSQLALSSRCLCMRRIVDYWLFIELVGRKRLNVDRVNSGGGTQVNERLFPLHIYLLCLKLSWKKEKEHYSGHCLATKCNNLSKTANESALRSETVTTKEWYADQAGAVVHAFACSVHAFARLYLNNHMSVWRTVVFRG